MIPLITIPFLLVCIIINHTQIPEPLMEIDLISIMIIVICCITTYGEIFLKFTNKEVNENA